MNMNGRVEGERERKMNIKGRVEGKNTMNSSAEGGEKGIDRRGRADCLRRPYVSWEWVFGESV